MGIHSYFASLNDLERIVRCPGRFKFEEHNVAAHSWKVSQYAMFFASIEEREGTTIDWKSLFEKTVNHDYGEVFIGDIKTPVKHASPELREMINNVEAGMVEAFIQESIPAEFQDLFRDRLKEGKDATPEGLLLEFADKLDQIYESFAELKRGNTDPEFVLMYTKALKRLLVIPLPASVAYFRNVILEDMVSEDSQIDVKALTIAILND